MNGRTQIRRYCVGGVFLCVACATTRASERRSEVLGRFVDDYEAIHVITSSEWQHGSRSRYHIVKWNVDAQYFIARNDPSNPADGGLWSRVDWVKLEGMAPWNWAYCMSAFEAPSADSAESTRVANRNTPRTGCNGFPFTRMRAAP